MSLYRRTGSPFWWIRFTVNGERVSKSSGTADKKKAQELHDKIKASLWHQEHLGGLPDYTWNDAVLAWLAEKGEFSSRTTYLSMFRWLETYLKNRPLKEIDNRVIQVIRLAKLKEEATKGTVNRLLGIVTTIYNYAIKNGMVDKKYKPSVQFFNEDEEARVRWLTPDEQSALFRELPSYLAEIVRFALVTGLRHGNIVRLKWEQLDLVRRVAFFSGNEVKNRTPFVLHLNADAVEIIRRQIGKHQEYVFTYEGRQLLHANNKAWKQAVERAGLKNFRFHDLRHTWATRHIDAGTSIYELQVLGGWKDPTMVRRYGHLQPEHLARAAERISQSGTKSVQPDDRSVSNQ